eukprot:12930708-Prorocentrum_lima.AAC.1
MIDLKLHLDPALSFSRRCGALRSANVCCQCSLSARASLQDPLCHEHYSGSDHIHVLSRRLED